MADNDGALSDPRLALSRVTGQVTSSSMVRRILSHNGVHPVDGSEDFDLSLLFTPSEATLGSRDDHVFTVIQLVEDERLRSIYTAIRNSVLSDSPLAFPGTDVVGLEQSVASFRALCEIALQHRSQPVRECVDFTPLRLQIQLQLAHTVGQVHATSMVPLGRLGGGPLDQADSVDSRVQLRLVARQVSGFGNNKRTTKFTRVWHVPDLQVAAHNTPLSNLLGDTCDFMKYCLQCPYLYMDDSAHRHNQLFRFVPVVSLYDDIPVGTYPLYQTLDQMKANFMPLPSFRRWIQLRIINHGYCYTSLHGKNMVYLTLQMPFPGWTRHGGFLSSSAGFIEPLCRDIHELLYTTKQRLAYIESLTSKAYPDWYRAAHSSQKCPFSGRFGLVNGDRDYVVTDDQDGYVTPQEQNDFFSHDTLACTSTFCRAVRILRQCTNVMENILGSDSVVIDEAFDVVRTLFTPPCIDVPGAYYCSTSGRPLQILPRLIYFVFTMLPWHHYRTVNHFIYEERVRVFHDLLALVPTFGLGSFRNCIVITTQSLSPCLPAMLHCSDNSGGCHPVLKLTVPVATTFHCGGFAEFNKVDTTWANCGLLVGQNFVNKPGRLTVPYLVHLFQASQEMLQEHYGDSLLVSDQTVELGLSAVSVRFMQPARALACESDRDPRRPIHSSSRLSEVNPLYTN